MSEELRPYGRAVQSLMQEKGFTIPSLGKAIWALGYPGPKNEKSAIEAVRYSITQAERVHHAFTVYVGRVMDLSEDEMMELYRASRETGEQYLTEQPNH